MTDADFMLAYVYQEKQHPPCSGRYRTIRTAELDALEALANMDGCGCPEELRGKCFWCRTLHKFREVMEFPA